MDDEDGTIMTSKSDLERRIQESCRGGVRELARVRRDAPNRPITNPTGQRVTEQRDDYR